MSIRAVVDVARRPPLRRAVAAALGNRGLTATTVGAFAFYLFISLTDYAQYLSGNDLGIFDQAVRAYAHFDAPLVPVKGRGFDILGDHFHPIIAVLAPLYWIWDSPCMLLIAQAGLVASSIPIVHRFIRRRASQRLSLTLTAVYALAWPVQSMVDFDFHEIAFAVPLLALAIDALDRRNVRTLAISCGLLLLVREDMGIFVALLGLLLWSRIRAARSSAGDRRRRLSAPPRVVAALVVLGLAAFAVATFAIVPTMSRNGSYHYWQFGAIGSDFPAALHTLVTRPWHVVHVLFSPVDKLGTWIALVAPLLWFPARSPYAVLAVPLLAERFLNERPQLWNMNYHYSVLPWLVLLLAFVDGAARAGLFSADAATARRRFVMGWMVSTFVILAAVRFADWPYSPLHRATHWNEASVLARRGADDAIPHNACVAASSWLIPHLTPHDWVTLPDVPLDGIDFVALDESRPHITGYATTPAVLAAARSAGYVTVYHRGAVVVLRSPSYRGPSSNCGPLGRG